MKIDRDLCLEVHKLEVYVYDFDGIGIDNVKRVIEDHRYPNRCLHPEVLGWETRKLYDWNEDHYLNKRENRFLVKDLFSDTTEIEDNKPILIFKVNRQLVIDKMIETWENAQILTSENLVKELLLKGSPAFQSKSNSTLEYNIIESPFLIEEFLKTLNVSFEDLGEIIVSTEIQNFEVEEV